MATALFIGVVERAKSGFGVFFPDVPGCTSAGDTVLDAMKHGEQALAAHIQLLVESGDPIPEPSTAVSIDKDVDVETSFLARVDLPGKVLRLNITMDESLVASIDRVAKNRSAFLADAARAKLAVCQ